MKIQARPESRRLPRRTGMLLLALCAASCAGDPAPPAARTGASFGSAVFELLCQRMASRSAQALHRLSPDGSVDVSGSTYRAACRTGDPGALPEVAAATDVVALIKRHDELVEALDLLLPADQAAALGRLTEAVAPLTDDGRLPRAVDAIGAALGALHEDAGAQASLAWLNARVGYLPRALSAGFLREALTYERLPELGRSLLSAFRDGGSLRPEFNALLSGVSYAMQTVGRNGAAVTRPVGATAATWAEALEALFLVRDQAFSSLPNHNTLAVKRDLRGLAKVVPRLPTGSLPAPFVDENADHLADVADDLGDFRTARPESHAPSPFPSPGAADAAGAVRDSLGRAIASDGAPLYEYLALDDTLLVAAVHAGQTLFEPRQRSFGRLAWLNTSLLGPRAAVSRRDGDGGELRFSGVDTARSPLLDLAHALLQLLSTDAAAPTLALAGKLVKDDEPAVAGAARALGAGLDIAAAHSSPCQTLSHGERLYDDLLRVGQQIAQHDDGLLLREALQALARPETASLARMIATFATYRDVHRIASGATKLATADPSCEKKQPFCVPVDRTQSDSGLNRSIFQRSLHVIANSNGMRICNKEGARLSLPGLAIPFAGPFKECDLFEIPNGAVFYAQSMAFARDAHGQLGPQRKAHLRIKTENLPAWINGLIATVGEDQLLRLLSGVDSLTAHPSPEAINRLLFAPPAPSLAAVMAPAVDVDGHVLADYHRGSLVSWEMPQPDGGCDARQPCRFIDALSPLAQAFADHNAEQLFVDLITVLHRHWPTAASATHQIQQPLDRDFVFGTSAMRFEPTMAALFASDKVVAPVASLIAATERTAIGGTQTGLDAVTRLARVVLGAVPVPADAGRPYVAQNFTDGAHAALGQALCGNGRCHAGDICDDPSRGLCRAAGLFAFEPGGELPAGAPPKVFASRAPALLDAIVDAGAGLARGLRELEERAGGQATEARLRASQVSDALFSTLPGPGGSARFENPLTMPVLAHVLALISDRLALHQQQSDAGSWLSTELPVELDRALTSPVWTGLVDLFAAIEQTPCAKAVPGRAQPTPLCPRDELYRFAARLLQDAERSDSFRVALSAIADMLELAQADSEVIAPLFRRAGTLLAPSQGHVDALMNALDPLLSADTENVIAALLGNAMRPTTASGRSVFDALLDGALAVNRSDPAASAPYRAADFRGLLGSLHAFVADPETGLSALFEVIRKRCDGPCAPTSGEREGP